MHAPTRRLLVLAAVAVSASLTVGTGVALSAGPTSDQQVAGHKQDLAAGLQAEQQQADAARAARPTAPVHPVTPAPAGPPVLQAPPHHGQVGTEALYGGIPLPFRPGELSVTNLYLDLRGQTYLGVYGGAVPTDPQQGQILVHTDNPLGPDPAYRSGSFPTPLRDGTVTLTHVTGALVQFHTAHHSGTYNLATHQYGA